MTPLQLADDRMCFGCGEKNPRGLKLPFKVDLARRRIRTRWTPTKEFQGYADIMHGGILGLVLDELMGNLLWKLGCPSVTVELTVRFRHPARVGEPIEGEGWVVSEEPLRSRKRIVTESVARRAGGRILATASATYFPVRNKA